MPMMPTTSTHVWATPNRDPDSEVDTMSPMSTKPPIAVRMPSVTASRRFTRALRRTGRARPRRLEVLERLVGDVGGRAGQDGVRLDQQRAELIPHLLGPLV